MGTLRVPSPVPPMPSRDPPRPRPDERELVLRALEVDLRDPPVLFRELALLRDPPRALVLRLPAPLVLRELVFRAALLRPPALLRALLLREPPAFRAPARELLLREPPPALRDPPDLRDPPRPPPREDSPASERSLFTVRAAISSARSVLMPRL